MLSNHLILCCPLLLSVFSRIRVFPNESALQIRWTKYWNFSFNISSFYEYSGLISFRIDWIDLPAVQGTLKSLLQHHSLKAPVLLCSAFFTVRREWQPTPAFLPGEFHGQRRLMGYSLWGCKKSDTTRLNNWAHFFLKRTKYCWLKPTSIQTPVRAAVKKSVPEYPHPPPPHLMIQRNQLPWAEWKAVVGWGAGGSAFKGTF